MPVIYQPEQLNFRILKGETKTAYPELRHLPPGLSHEDVAAGEIVGIKTQLGADELTLEKITAANEVDQAANAAIRIDDTKYDTMESGGVTVLEGLFVIKTEAYDANGSYSVGDLVTAVYDAGVDGGVFGPVTDGTTEWAIGKVESPPVDASQNTPMRIKVFPNPIDVSTRT